MTQHEEGEEGGHQHHGPNVLHGLEDLAGQRGGRVVRVEVGGGEEESGRRVDGDSSRGEALQVRAREGGHLSRDHDFMYYDTV